MAQVGQPPQAPQQYDQAGLEAIPDHAGLQLAHQNGGQQQQQQQFVYYGGQYYDKDAINAQQHHPLTAGEDVARVVPRRRSVWLGWPGFVGAALLSLILGGVIGGLIGWKVTANNSIASNSTSGDSFNGASKTIRQNSPLAVTGYRIDSDPANFNIRLFFQGPDDLLRYSNLDTIYNRWSAPQVINVTAKSGTPIAVSTLLTPGGGGLPALPQTEFFYLGPDNRLLGQNWRPGYPLRGGPDSVNSYNFVLSGPQSRIATFWPSVVMQSEAGNVREVFYTDTVGFTERPSGFGSNILSDLGSALVLLPTQASYVVGDNTTASLRLLYRRTDGNLYLYDRSEKGEPLSSSGSLGIALPANASMAGMTTARAGDATGVKVNTYLLYQDSDGSIKYLAQLNDGQTSLSGPGQTDAVFATAANPTQLACLTAATSSAAGVNVPLLPRNDMNRCYFQVKDTGAIREVMHDGTKWVDMGLLPMP